MGPKEERSVELVNGRSGARHPLDAALPTTCEAARYARTAYRSALTASSFCCAAIMCAWNAGATFVTRSLSS